MKPSKIPKITVKHDKTSSYISWGYKVMGISPGNHEQIEQICSFRTRLTVGCILDLSWSIMIRDNYIYLILMEGAINQKLEWNWVELDTSKYSAAKSVVSFGRAVDSEALAKMKNLIPAMWAGLVGRFSGALSPDFFLDHPWSPKIHQLGSELHRSQNWHMFSLPAVISVWTCLNKQ